MNLIPKRFSQHVLTSIDELLRIYYSRFTKNDDEEENLDSEINYKYSSIEKIVDALENFYGTKEDQNLLLRELSAMKINKNEKIKDFNIKYRSLYL